jgi:hypothetical protein
MDPRPTLARFFAWRWTPCVAPVVGSLSFVVLCIAVVPDDIGPVTASPTGAVPTKSVAGSTELGTSSDDDAAGPNEDSPRSPARHRLAPTPRITSRTTGALGSFLGRSRTTTAAEHLPADNTPSPSPALPPEAPAEPPAAADPQDEPDFHADPDPDTSLR